MRKQTSTDTYNKIKASKLLSKRRFEVYEALFQFGPLTANDVVRRMKSSGHYEANQTGWNARFSELEKMGVIEEVGRKNDDVSGHECIVWDVTDKLPTPLPKNNKRSKSQLKKELLSATISLGQDIDEKWKSQLRKMYLLIIQL